MIVGNKITAAIPLGTAVQVAGPNPNRVGLLLLRPNANDYWLDIGAVAAAQSSLNVTTSMAQPTLIMFDEPNDWITQPISIFSGAGCNVVLYEFVRRVP